MKSSIYPFVAASVCVSAIAFAQTQPSGREETVRVAPATQPTTRPTSPAAATHAYFREVSRAIDEAVLEPAATLETPVYAQYARRIVELPQELVDTDVLAWGGTVTAKLNDAANAIELGKQRAQSRSAAVASPGGFGEGPDAEARARAEMQNAQRQRRQAAVEERARGAEEATRILRELQEPRLKIAETITARHGAAPVTQPATQPS